MRWPPIPGLAHVSAPSAPASTGIHDPGMTSGNDGSGACSPLPDDSRRHPGGAAGDRADRPVGGGTAGPSGPGDRGPTAGSARGGTGDGRPAQVDRGQPDLLTWGRPAGTGGLGVTADPVPEPVRPDAGAVPGRWTGRPPTVDALHTDGHILIDRQGRGRFLDAGRGRLLAGPRRRWRVRLRRRTVPGPARWHFPRGSDRGVDPGRPTGGLGRHGRSVHRRSRRRTHLPHRPDRPHRPAAEQLDDGRSRSE